MVDMFVFVFLLFMFSFLHCSLRAKGTKIKKKKKKESVTGQKLRKAFPGRAMNSTNFHRCYLKIVEVKDTNGRQETCEISMFTASFILVSCVKLP